MQWGAQFMFILFKARRGGENIENMKKTDMAVLEDKIKNFELIFHVCTEAHKNHALGTDTKKHC